MIPRRSLYIPIARSANFFLRDHFDRLHSGFMSTKDTAKKLPLGPTGERVAENVKRLRGSMQYKELAEKLEVAGRTIPTLGLRRIEAGERRVDADDLTALAIVFGVSPLTLLLPSDGSAKLASGVTGFPERRLPHNALWQWGLGEDPLPVASNDQPTDSESSERFRLASRPAITERDHDYKPVATNEMDAWLSDRVKQSDGDD